MDKNALTDADAVGRCISPAEAAKILGIGKGRCYRMCRAGELPSIKLGSKSVRVPVAALDRWIEERLGGSGPD